MRIIYGFILGIILILIFIVSYRKTKDVFSPMCIFSTFQFLRYVPNIITAKYEYFYYLDEFNTFKLMCIELIVIFSVTIGYLFHDKKLHSNCKKFEVRKRNETISLGVILFIYIIGLSSRLLVIYKSGGIQYIIRNAGVAYMGLSSGFGYIMSLSNLMLISMLMLLDKIKLRSRLIYKFLLLLLASIYAFTYLLFTSRSPVLEMVMILAFGYNYLIKKYKISDVLKPRFIIFTLLILSFIVIMPIIRTTNNGNVLSAKEISNELKENFKNLFDEFSNVGRDAFVYDYFNLHNFWWGRSYLNLLKAPIPSSIFPDKPPIDDGMYLNQLLHGYTVDPNQGRTSLYVKYSIPFSTQGAMYANFGIVGVIISEFLLGMLYAKIYKLVIDTRDIFAIILYQLIIYQLELTTLSIAQTLIPLVIIWVVYKPISGVRFFGRKYYVSNKIAGRVYVKD